MTPHITIIAEAGVNHNGDLSLAKKLVDAALEAEADAIKFQTFKSEKLVTKDAESADYQRKNTGGQMKQFEILKALELSYADFTALRSYCDDRKILFLSSPFDEDSARFLIRDLGMEKIKIPSGEIINHPFLEYLASFGRPLILSTGMSDLEEIREAVRTIQKVSSAIPITLLHCTTNYPCPYEEVNLRAMQTLRETFRLPVGYSDHTEGIEVPIAAAALGATVIEKHFTLDRKLSGPDHLCSLEPEELKLMVRAVRNIEKAMGSPEKRPSASEMRIREKVRKSLVLTRSLSAGTTLTRDNLTAKRPSGGISPIDFEKLIGRRLKVGKKKDEKIEWTDLE